MVQFLGGFGGRFAMNQKFNNAMIGTVTCPMPQSWPRPSRVSRPRATMAVISRPPSTVIFTRRMTEYCGSYRVHFAIVRRLGTDASPLFERVFELPWEWNRGATGLRQSSPVGKEFLELACKHPKAVDRASLDALCAITGTPCNPHWWCVSTLTPTPRHIDQHTSRGVSPNVACRFQCRPLHQCGLSTLRLGLLRASPSPSCASNAGITTTFFSGRRGSARLWQSRCSTSILATTALPAERYRAVVPRSSPPAGR